MALASLFSVMILVTRGFGLLPEPTADYLIAFEAFFLALSFLVTGPGGATYVGAVAGILLTVVTGIPPDLVFAIFFGVLVDATSVAFRARQGNDAKTSRLVAAITVSTGIVGLIAYYVFAVMTNIVPNDIGLDASRSRSSGSSAEPSAVSPLPESGTGT